MSLPYESTIATVMPRPSMPRLKSGPRLYAAQKPWGVKQRRATALHWASVGGVAPVETSW